MRLIDADALKEKFKERSYWTYTHEYGDAIPIGWIMSGIDNAPTVEPDMDFAKECYANGYEDGKNERPQGEWINTRPPEMSDNIVCSLCGYDSIASFNYCPNCGADMRKGGAE
jgi:hypothetical protein